MIIIREEFITIPRGKYSVGLKEDFIDPLCDRLRDRSFKKEFLVAAMPSHPVIAGPVMIRKYLTTVDEYSEFIADTGYRTEAEQEGWGWVLLDGRWHKRAGVDWKRPFGPSGDVRSHDDGKFPVMQVTWNDAAAYCSWLSEKNERKVSLPQEVEWEIFAGMCGVATAMECAGERVFVYEPEEFLESVRSALCATTHCSVGIIWEWTEDWYDRYPGGHCGRDFGTVYKVLRGGSIMSHPVQRAREFRLRKCPTARSPYYGFRIAIHE